MNKITSIIIVILILFSAVASPALAAKETIKEPFKTSKVIEKAPAELSGKINAESTHADAIEITKDSHGIRMKADLPKGNDEVEITLSQDVIKEIPNCDGNTFYAHHFLDDGTYDGYQEVKVNKKGDTKFVAKFSETILNGWSGYYQVTQTINMSSDTFSLPSLPDGATYDRVVVSLPGADGTPINFSDPTTLPQNDSLVALYPFETDYNDYSGNDNHGTPTNMSIVDGAAIFNGIDSYINCGKDSSLDITDSKLTIYANIERDNIGTYQRIIDKNYNLFSLALWNNNLINFNVDGDARYSTSTITDTAKHSIMSVYDLGSWYIYLDSDLDSSGAHNGTLVPNTYNLYIGAISSGLPSQFFSGKIYELCIYNSVLSPHDAITLHTSINGTSLTTPTNTHHAFNSGSLTLTNVPGGEYSIQSSDASVGEETGTVYALFTEPTTLIEESETDGEVFISINHTAGVNSSAGWIEYDVGLENFTYNLSMISTNPNATATYHNFTINVSTGPLAAGESHWYNFTLQSAEDFYYEVTWLTKTDTSASFNYESNNQDVPQNIHLSEMDDSFLLVPYTYYLTFGTTTLLQTSHSVDGELYFTDVSPMKTGTYYISTQAPPKILTQEEITLQKIKTMFGLIISLCILSTFALVAITIQFAINTGKFDSAIAIVIGGELIVCSLVIIVFYSIFAALT
jgi:hypothetical protein